MTKAQTIERMAGQRIMAGFHGTTLNPDLRFLIDTVGACGIILFSRNIESADQLRDLCAGAADYAASAGLPRLLIAVDQEGGSVARLKPPQFEYLPGAPELEDETDAKTCAALTAKQFRWLHINMNMAPVLDVAPPEFDSIMNDRIYGRDPDRVSRMGRAVIQGLSNGGILPVAKHFPGIGRTTSDSHFDRPDLAVSLESLENYDLIPFGDAIRADVSGIMLSHIRYPAIDGDWPASLSTIIARDLLRNKLGYTGAVFTDDLEMGAISKYYDISEIMERVLETETDVALICESCSLTGEAFEAMCRHLADSPAHAEKAKQSIRRIAALKEFLNEPN